MRRALPEPPIESLDLSGGFIVAGPHEHVASANITPDPSGIPYYNVDLFLEVMRTGQAKGAKEQHAAADGVPDLRRHARRRRPESGDEVVTESRDSRGRTYR